MTASIVFLVIGFAILLYSGDCLVRGALAAAYKSNVSPLLVGIVIVGFGTSMPEFCRNRPQARDARLTESPALAERISRDVDHDKFIAWAIASDTRTIISGDNDLLIVSG